ncbi:MAG: hypothetical protein ABW217_20845, partial [Polyangiaceae bacterium]
MHASRSLTAAALVLSALAVLGIYLSIAPGGTRSAGSPASTTEAARLPMIDLHVHVSPDGVARLLGLMQQHGIVAAVNLSGGHASDLELQLAAARQSGGRLLVFTTLAYEQVRYPDFGERMALLLRHAHALGARGLKIAKVLGLGLRTRDGRLLAV